MPWTSDVLGNGFECRALQLQSDDEGLVIATLVRKRAETSQGETRRAVLYVHGYVDYFFQEEMADQYLQRGWDFYALDLRKYGRSLLPHQTPMYITDIHTYFEDIDAALQIVRNEDKHDIVFANAHSTGGLIVSLYAHARRKHNVIDALMLNSPFLDFNFPWIVRKGLGPVLSVLGKAFPRVRVRKPFTPFYAYSLLRQYHGEWEYNLDWKPVKGFPMHLAWIRAIRNAHREVDAGLDIPCPILVMSSTRSTYPLRWNEDIPRTDVVLSVDQISHQAMRLGNLVTRIKVPNAIHDLMLSAQPVRHSVYQNLFRWADCYLPVNT